jgi:transposase
VFEDTASVLFGLDGLRVADVEREADGTVMVWAVTWDAETPRCPGCGTVARRAHETVVTRPKDVRRGSDLMRLCWVKRRWKCEEPSCARRTFTEAVPQVPARRRVTERLREQVAAEIADRGIPAAEAARWAGVSWPVAHAAFAGRADPVVAQAARPVAHLGIDEHRRGKPRPGRDEETGECRLLADR